MLESVPWAALGALLRAQGGALEAVLPSVSRSLVAPESQKKKKKKTKNRRNRVWTWVHLNCCPAQY